MDLRTAFNDFGDMVYLNASHKGPLPKVAQAAIRTASHLQAEPWRLTDEMWFQVPDRTRALIAQVIGARPEEVAITTSTSYGMNLLAQGLPWKSGDTILLIRGNFPSNVYPWMNVEAQGARVQFVESTRPGDVVTQAQLEAQIMPGVRVVAIDYPHWTNGYLMDLRALKTKCEEVDAWLVLDCSQSIGAVPVDVTQTPIDAIVASGYKFMLCPYGTGFMYVPRARHEELAVTMPTWMGMKNAQDFSQLNEYDFSPVDSAARLDVGGHTAFLQMMGMSASLEFLLDVGIERIYQHVLQLVDRLVAGLDPATYRVISDLTPERRSAMLRFVLMDPTQLSTTLKRLKEHKIFVSFRDNGFRVTPHIYNNDQDIDRFLKVL